MKYPNVLLSTFCFILASVMLSHQVEVSSVFTSVSFDPTSEVWPGEKTVFRCIISMDIFLSDYQFFIQWPYGVWSSALPVQPSNIYDIQNTTHREVGKVVYQSTYDDDGKYTCTATTVDSPVESHSEQKRLTVLSSTKALTMTPADGSTLTLTEGSQGVPVKCKAELANPEAEITWILNDRSIHLDPRFTVQSPIITGASTKGDPRKSTESTVVVKGFKELHGEELSCRAKSKADSTFRVSSVNIDILYKPMVSLKMEPELIHPQHSSIQIQCIVDSNPAPSSYIWSLDNSRLQFANEEILTLEVNPDMEQKKISCEVSNEIEGNIETASASLILHFAQAPEFLKEPTNRVVKEGDPFELECEASGEPDPEIEWYREDNAGQILARGSKFSVSSAKKSHNGRYCCRATVPSIGFDPIISTATVQIFGEPVIVMDAKKYVQIGDTDVTLDCVVDASMVKPSYLFWRANGIQLPEGTFQRYEVVREEHEQWVSLKLIISKVTSDDLGQYNCTAYNEAGINSKVLFLETEEVAAAKIPHLVMMIILAAIILTALLAILCFVIIWCRSRRNKTTLNSPFRGDVAPSYSQRSTSVATSQLGDNFTHLKTHASNNSLESSTVSGPYYSHYSTKTSLEGGSTMGTMAKYQYDMGMPPVSSHHAFVGQGHLTSHPLPVMEEGNLFRTDSMSQHHDLHSSQHHLNRRSMPPISVPVSAHYSTMTHHPIFVDPHTQSVHYASLPHHHSPAAGSGSHPGSHGVPSHHVIPSDQIDYGGGVPHPMFYLTSHSATPSNDSRQPYDMRRTSLQPFLVPRSSTSDCVGDANCGGACAFTGCNKGALRDSLGGNQYSDEHSCTSDATSSSYRFRSALPHACQPLEVDSGVGSSIQESPPIATTTLLQLANEQEHRAKQYSPNDSVNSSSMSRNVARRPLKPPPYDSSQSSPINNANNPYTGSVSSGGTTVERLNRRFVKPSASMEHISKTRAIPEYCSDNNGGAEERGDMHPIRNRAPSVSTFKPTKPDGQMQASNISLNRVGIEQVFDPSVNSLPGVSKGENYSNMSTVDRRRMQEEISRQHTSPTKATSRSENEDNDSGKQFMRPQCIVARKTNKTFIAQTRPSGVNQPSGAPTYTAAPISSDSSEMSDNPNSAICVLPGTGMSVVKDPSSTMNFPSNRRKPSMKNKVRFCDEDTSYPTDADVEDSDFSDISSSYSQSRSSGSGPMSNSRLSPFDHGRDEKGNPENSPQNRSFALV